MPENITIVNQELYNYNNRFIGRKPAKMGEIKVINIRKKRNELKTPVASNTNTNVNLNTNTNLNYQEEVKPNHISMPTNEVKEESVENVIKFPSKEVYETRLNEKGVVCYNDLKGNLNLEASRRLRVNNLVAKVDAHVTNTVGIEYPTFEKEIEVEEEVASKPTFDFSSLQGMTKEAPKENKVVQIEDYWNKENKVETPISKPVQVSTNDEINSLTKENNSLRQSLETQKEILADMKRKVDEYNLMSQSKKQELEEENLALTRELNDVLAEINKLNDIANEQEAFLGIAAGNENSYGRR